MFGGRGDARSLESFCEGHASGGDAAGLRAEGALLVGDESRRARDVEHGREVDVDPDALQRGARGRALLPRELRSAPPHRRRAGRRRAGQALDLAALLVDRDDHRGAQISGARRRLDRGRELGELRAAAHVVVEVDDAADLAVGDGPEQALRRARAVEAADDAAARELAGRQLGDAVGVWVRRRRRAESEAERGDGPRAGEGEGSPESGAGHRRRTLARGVRFGS